MIDLSSHWSNFDRTHQLVFIVWDFGSGFEFAIQGTPRIPLELKQFEQPVVFMSMTSGK